MRLNAVFLSLSGLLLGSAWASVIDYIDQYPACGLACVTELLPGSVCQTPTNDTCICTDAGFAALVQPCILEKCTVIEALTVQRVQAEACNAPVRSRRSDFWGIVAVEVITLPCAVLRLWARHALDQAYQWDDYLMMIIIPAWLAFTVCGNFAAFTAFGVDLYTIADPDVISRGTELFWICEAFYFFALGLCKLMVVCFMLRIFPQRKFRRTAYAIMVYVGLFTVIAEGCLIFQCVPVQSIWLGWRGDFGAYTCLNVNLMTLVLAGQQILQDLVILVLPVPLLLRLNVSLRKKLGIFFMFSLGIFVVVTSCVRLQYLLIMGDSENPTYDYTDVIIWTGLELDVSVIVASLPALRKYLGRRFDAFGSSNNGPSQGSSEQSSGARYPRDYKSAREHRKTAERTSHWRLSSWSNVASRNDADCESQIELGLDVKGTTHADVSTPRHACYGSGDPLNGNIVVSSQTVVSSRKGSWDEPR